MRLSVWVGLTLAALAGISAAQTTAVHKIDAVRRDKVNAYLKLAQDSIREAGTTDPILQITLNSARQDMAKATAAVGDIAGARQMAASFATITEKVETLSAIAEVQARDGDLAGARETIAQANALVLPVVVPRVHERDLESIGTAQARMGDIAGAQETARLLGFSPFERAYVLGWVGWKQAKQGDAAGAKVSFAAALEALAQEVSKESMAWSSQGIAERQVEAGDFSGAVATMRQPAATVGRAAGLAVIGRKLAEAGRPMEARKMLAEARRILAEARAASPGALADIGVGLARAGDGPGAKEVFAAARKAAEAMSDERREKGPALASLALLLKQAGDEEGSSASMKQAVEAVAKLRESSDRAYAWWRIAELQAIAGELKESRLSIAKALGEGGGSTGSTARAARNIAREIAHGDGAGADLEWIQKLGPAARAQAYAGAALGMVE